MVTGAYRKMALGYEVVFFVKGKLVRRYEYLIEIPTQAAQSQ